MRMIKKYLNKDRRQAEKRQKKEKRQAIIDELRLK